MRALPYMNETGLCMSQAADKAIRAAVRAGGKLPAELAAKFKLTKLPRGWGARYALEYK